MLGHGRPVRLARGRRHHVSVERAGRGRAGHYRRGERDLHGATTAPTRRNDARRDHDDTLRHADDARAEHDTGTHHDRRDHHHRRADHHPSGHHHHDAVAGHRRHRRPRRAASSRWARDSGSDTARIQQRLLDLGFWLSGVDGDYGTTTSQAVMAFQKYSGLDPTGRVNQETADALTNTQFRAHGRADAGSLVEIDKDLQLIFIVKDGHTLWVLNTSTGGGYSYTWTDPKKPGEVQTDVAITRNGLHAIYRQHDEGWWDGDLGKIYRPKYFSGGEAIHGFNNVPNYPASHGCVRVSIAGDGLHLGQRPDADGHPRVGARRRHAELSVAQRIASAGHAARGSPP